MNYDAMLLGAQAAGIGANLYAARQQQRMTELGIEVEQGEVALRMKEEQLAFTEANIASLDQLQEVMATQRAILGARGQAPGVGSALAVGNKSTRAQSADQRARNLSKSFRQNQYEGTQSLLGIKKAGARAQFGNSLIAGGLSSFNLNMSIGEYIEKNKKTSSNPSKATYMLKSSING